MLSSKTRRTSIQLDPDIHDFACTLFLRCYSGDTESATILKETTRLAKKAGNSDYCNIVNDALIIHDQILDKITLKRKQIQRKVGKKWSNRILSASMFVLKGQIIQLSPQKKVKLNPKSSETKCKLLEALWNLEQYNTNATSIFNTKIVSAQTGCAPKDYSALREKLRTSSFIQEVGTPLQNALAVKI